MMSRNFTPEQTLIDKFLLDDTEAFEELSRRYCYSLYSYCVNKLNSEEDARRVVRNVFISLWESRHRLPFEFSLSVYLYTEVRKAVVQCINSKLNTNTDITAIEEEIIPGFSVDQLQKAKQFVQSDTTSVFKERRYEEQISSINLKKLKHAFQNMLNTW
jgi:RNA polymerase sigma-70 factor (ECF subfamily)